MRPRVRSHKDTPATESIDNRIIAAMRLVLASSALLIVYLVPTEPNRFVVVTYATLCLYVVFSGLLYYLTFAQAEAFQSLYRWIHWIDVGWYVLLIALSRGTSSIFFFGFFFAILVASFRWGFVSGLNVTVASVILFVVVGVVTAPPGPQFELDRFLIRPVYLLVLGYMMAYWGEFEIRYKRRLELLKEVATLSNPRFGVDRTIGSLMEQLRTFYDADTCLLISIDSSADEYHMRYTDGSDQEMAMRVEQIPEELARQFLTLPPELAVVYNARLLRWWPRDTSYYAFNVVTGQRTAEGREMSAALIARLEAESFATVPLWHHKEMVGRFYLASRHTSFDRSDVEFLLQVFDQVLPVIDNIRLVDRLASDAAEEERQRIARDLHDSVIQPYIGLRIGLTAVDQKLAEGADVSHDIKRLVRRIDEEVADLRGHMRGLKSVGRRSGSLVPALQRFAAKFAETTHLDVQVEAPAELFINDRLAAEVFQMAAEGLSNIRRHTHATQARICLMSGDDRLVLHIENNLANGTRPAPFTPRSIAERAAVLGGRARVEQNEERTAVVVEIPL